MARWPALGRLASNEARDNVTVNRLVELLEIEQHEQGSDQPPNLVDDCLCDGAYHYHNVGFHRLRLCRGRRPDKSVHARAGKLAPSEPPMCHSDAESGLGWDSER